MKARERRLEKFQISIRRFLLTDLQTTSHVRLVNRGQFFGHRCFHYDTPLHFTVTSIIFDNNLCNSNSIAERERRFHLEDLPAAVPFIHSSFGYSFVVPHKLLLKRCQVIKKGRDHYFLFVTWT